MPSSRDIQRRVKRLELTNTFEKTRFTFNVKTLVALLGEDWLKLPGLVPQNTLAQFVQHEVTTDRR
jgi:hypothetical protein